MNCTRVDHVGIAVKDLAASVKWYEETLGLHSKGTVSYTHRTLPTTERV